MKPICLLFVLPLLGTGCRTEQSAYLEKALSQLERIERVAYRRSSESYLPGDTIPRRYLRYYVEQRNRADTTLRHSYLLLLQRRRHDTHRRRIRRNDRRRSRPRQARSGHRRLLDSPSALPPDGHDLFSAGRRPSCATCSPPPIRSAPSSPLRRRIPPAPGHRSRLRSRILGPPLLQPPAARTVSRSGALGLRNRLRQRADALQTAARTDAPDHRRLGLRRAHRLRAASAARLEAYYPDGYMLRKRKLRNQAKKPYDIVGRQAPDWTLVDAERRVRHAFCGYTPAEKRPHDHRGDRQPATRTITARTAAFADRTPVRGYAEQKKREYDMRISKLPNLFLCAAGLLDGRCTGVRLRRHRRRTLPSGTVGGHPPHGRRRTLHHDPRRQHLPPPLCRRRRGHGLAARSRGGGRRGLGFARPRHRHVVRRRQPQARHSRLRDRSGRRSARGRRRRTDLPPLVHHALPLLRRPAPARDSARHPLPARRRLHARTAATSSFRAATTCMSTISNGRARGRSPATAAGTRRSTARPTGSTRRSSASRAPSPSRPTRGASPTCVSTSRACRSSR